MHIKYICQAFINKATYKYGILVMNLLRQLVIITVLLASYQCSWSMKFWHGSRSLDPFPKKGHDSWTVQIFWIFDIKFFFLVVLEFKEIKNTIYRALATILFRHKTSDISQNFVTFCYTKFRDILRNKSK
jgi:hypothetical protein